MDFSLKDVLEAVGPTSGLIFASWIFMGFLQQRYMSAFERYRLLIESYRSREPGQERLGNIRDQVLLYKRRCELMKIATNLGLIAAVFLILTLIAVALHVLFPQVNVLKYVSTFSAILGLLLVIAAAVLVIRENTIIQRALDSELMDIPELAALTGQKSGDITDPHR